MQRDRLRGGLVEQRFVEPVGLERAAALLGRLRVVVHAHPHVGVHGVGALDSFARIVGQERASDRLEPEPIR